MAKDKKTFDMDLIRKLAEVLDETGLNEIEIGQDGLNVRVARGGGTAAVAASLAGTSPAPQVPEAGRQEIDDPASHPGAVTAPMVGTVYLSPAPGAAPFVTVGAEVKQGDTLLIIEAMKTMNQIPAPRAGKVTRILVANEQPVEFDEALVIIE